MTRSHTTTDLRQAVREGLAEARSRTLALLDSLAEEDQRAQHSPLMSPPVWDLAHVGNYEELWLLRAIDGRPPMDPALDDLYNAFEHPRWERPSLPILGPGEARAYLDGVRSEVLEVLDRVDLEAEEPLVRSGFVYGMVIQHEHQHAETLLATRQLMGEHAAAPPGSRPSPQVPGAGIGPEEVLIDGGTAWCGTSDHPWAYDNERPAHPVEVAPFWIDTAPVTNGAYAAFMADGGYDDPRLWSGAGWSWRNQEAQRHPLFWRREIPEDWSVLRFGERRDVALTEPVQHVCFHEAEAFARWAGKRLPTEPEWEVAATRGPDGAARRWPWGDEEPGPARANLGQRHDGPAPVGSFPAGATEAGVHQLVGDVWEWTSSDFRPYPGFRSFPYDEYSLVFFGSDHKVLRGGSWATHPVAARGTFRNWDYPIRRQIFSGFRCARDA